MKPVHHLNHELPIYTIQRRQWLNQMAERHREEADSSMEMLCKAVVLGILITGCILAVVL